MPHPTRLTSLEGVMSASDDDDAQGDSFNLFEEPKDFYKPEPEPTFATHQRLNGSDVTVRLVGHNPLWGHHLWNAGRTVSNHLEEHAKALIENKRVLELGAGSGLPSLICVLNGAAKAVVTDYPDADLVENLTYNIEHALPDSYRSSAVAEGYLWGNPVEKLLQHLGDDVKNGFDLLILADLLFNHSEHKKLVASVQKTLKQDPTAVALVFFTPYRPWLLEKDLAFFDLAREGGFKVDQIFEKVMDKVMFENDPGDELLRRTVYGYSLRWNQTIP